LPVTDIFIARHGETEYNRTGRLQGRGIDEPINENGQAQAHAVAEYLRDKNIAHIFSSSLVRSIETAEIIGRELDCPVHSYPELDEMDFGIMEGRRQQNIWGDIMRLHNRWKEGDTGFAFEQGESPETVLQRVVSCTNEILADYGDQPVLFVLHGRLIRILVAHWLEYGLSQMHRVQHQNGALYHLRLKENDHIEPVYLNRTFHLDKEPDQQSNI